jgi:ribose 5-phosphate isomerase RpiB
MNNIYIQDKLDAIENDLKEKGYTKFERETIIDIAKQSFTDYHNHIVEKIVKDVDMTDQQLQDILSLLQYTNKDNV